MRACSSTFAWLTPWNSKKSVGASGKSVFEKRLTMASCASSMISTRATGMPSWIVVMTARAAPSIEANGQTAAATASGRPWRRRVTSVMTPSVPSDPTNSRVRS